MGSGSWWSMFITTIIIPIAAITVSITAVSITAIIGKLIHTAIISIR